MYVCKDRGLRIELNNISFRSLEEEKILANRYIEEEWTERKKDTQEKEYHRAREYAKMEKMNEQLYQNG